MIDLRSGNDGEQKYSGKETQDYLFHFSILGIWNAFK